MTTSRGHHSPAYHLLTPPNRYASRLAELPGATVFKLATPRTGSARFGEYLVEIEPGGGVDAAIGGRFEHFVLGLAGTPVLDGEALPPGGFAYVPAGAGITLANRDGGDPARVMWVKREYEPVPGIAAPGRLRGQIDDLPVTTTSSGVLRRELLPTEDPAFDLNMSLLAFPPGIDLGMVEIHDEEHGLYMTSGQGVYGLDGRDHDVEAGDFIYMAPYCPQAFRSTGTETAEYLLYKDVYRDGFGGAHD